jgi:hypothetical protein
MPADLKSPSTICFTRSAPSVNSQCPGHQVHAEELCGVDHVLALRPQRGRRALPGVAAVQQQRAGRLAFSCLTSVARCAKPPTVPKRRAARSKSSGVKACASRVPAGKPALRSSARRRGAAPCRAGPEAEVDARLAKVARQQLRVAVGHVQHETLPRPLKRGGLVGRRRLRGSAVAEPEAATAAAPSTWRNSRRSSALTRAYWLTGLCGSSNNAITSRICALGQQPAWPKRGMPEQALVALLL